MKRFIEGVGRDQVTLLPDCLDDYVEAVNGGVKTCHWGGAKVGHLAQI